MDPNIRIGDAERDEAVRRLTTHHSQGRITIEEFDDRVQRAFDARTAGDLLAIFADLPGGPFDEPEPPVAPVPVYGPMLSVTQYQSEPFHRSQWFVWGVLGLVVLTGFRLWPLLALAAAWTWIVGPMVDGFRGVPAPQQFHFRQGDVEGEVRALLLAGRKIEAIKRFREHTGVGLAEAKAAVEEIERRERGIGR